MKRWRKRLILIAVPLLIAAFAWQSLAYRRLWWRTNREEATNAAAYIGPEGYFMVHSYGPGGDDYVRFDSDGSFYAMNRPRLITPWFALPISPGGVLLTPEGKGERDPGAFRKGDRWGFVDRFGRRVEFTGPAPFGDEGKAIQVSVLKSSDVEDRDELVALSQEAVELAKAHDFDSPVDFRLEGGFRYAAVFSAFCSRNHGDSDGPSHRIWMVVGDLPPLLFDAKANRIRSSADAFRHYANALERWLDHQKGEVVEGEIPVLWRRGSLEPIKPIPVMVDLVRRRLKLVRETMLPWVSEPNSRPQP